MTKLNAKWNVQIFIEIVFKLGTKRSRKRSNNQTPSCTDPNDDNESTSDNSEDNTKPMKRRRPNTDDKSKLLENCNVSDSSKITLTEFANHFWSHFTVEAIQCTPIL